MTSSATMNPATGPDSKAVPTSGTARLIADIEEVLAGAGSVADLDVAKLRDSLRQKIAMAKTGLATGGRRITATAGKAPGPAR